MFATLSAVWNVLANSVGWTQHAAHCNKICAKAAEQWSKGTLHSCLHWAEGAGRKRRQLYFHHHYRWRMLGVWVRPWDKAADVSVEDSYFTAEESTSSKQCQIGVGLFFLTMKALYIRNLFHQDRRWMENSIVTFWGEWGKTSSANIQKSGATPGPCIMTTLWLTHRFLCSSFWASMTTVIPHPPYLPDLTPCDYFLSWRWNWNSWSGILTAVKRSRMNCRTWWRHWCKMTSSSASDRGNPTGIAVSMQKGTTLKGMEANIIFSLWLSYGRGTVGTFG